MAKRAIYTHIDIQAPPEKVWDILVNFSQYPEWSQFIERIDGEAEAGANLTVSIRPHGQKAMQFTPLLQELVPNQALKWLGGLWGKRWLFLGEHQFRLEVLDESTTRLHHSENFSGFLVSLVWSALGKSTQQGFEHFNEALKKRAEN